MTTHRSFNETLKSILGKAKENFLLISVLIGILVGVILGLSLKSSTSHLKLFLTLPGQIFLRALSLLAVPVIFFSITSATTSLNTRGNLKITLFSIGLCLLCHIISTVIALCGSFLLPNISTETANVTLNNGSSLMTEKTINGSLINGYDIFSDILRNLIPNNIVKAFFSLEMTTYNNKGIKSGINKKQNKTFKKLFFNKIKNLLNIF